MTTRYHFENVDNCEMCGDNTQRHRVLGQRLNQSQGLSPKRKTGITVSVKKCSNCHLIYPSPLPIPFDIQDHYGIPPDEYWVQSYFEVHDSYFLKQINTAKKLLPFESDMTALDVGAGLGKGMIALQNSGFEAYGFEPSKPFYERAISKMRIDPESLKLGAIEEIKYPDNFFDFITFGAVVEHLYHPAASIEKAMKWLKPNGIIHIEVPSSRWLIPKMVNLYYRLIGTNYVTNISPMHVPFHLYEFDLKSFSLLGKKIGFTIVEHENDVCQQYFIPKVFHPLTKAIMEKTNTGMQLTVYLKKEC